MKGSNHKPKSKVRNALQRALTKALSWDPSKRRVTELERRRQEKTNEYVAKLPEELRDAILNEWLAANPPAIDSRDGDVKHYLINDGSKKLAPHAYHNLFRATSLQVTERLDASEPPPRSALVSAQNHLVDWLDRTPGFLKLHDQHFGEAAREKLRLAVRFEVLSNHKCLHNDATYVPRKTSDDGDFVYISRSAARPSSEEQPKPRCGGCCYQYARERIRKWCYRFLFREGIPLENATFELIFTPESRFEKQTKWARQHPAQALWQVFSFVCFGVLFPIVATGTVIYVTPIWIVFLSRKLRAEVWPKVELGLKEVGSTTGMERYLKINYLH